MAKKKIDVQLGQEVEDTVTGFRGIAVAKSIFLNGCTRIGVQPKVDKEGKLPEAQWFDEPQLKIIEEEPKVSSGNRKVGGPVPIKPTRAADARR